MTHSITLRAAGTSKKLRQFGQKNFLKINSVEYNLGL